MEKVYRNTNFPQIKEFEKLLNTEFSKTKAEEGQIVEGTVTKKTEKVVYVDIKNGKSEGVIELSELKLLKEDNIEIGSKIDVFLEKIENKHGEIVISREKARRAKSWKKMEKAFENKEEVKGTIISRVKGQELNDALTTTGKIIIIYSILFSLGWWIG